MNPLARIVTELRDRKLLPVVILLLVAIIAVPVALSKNAPASRLAPTAPITPAGAGTGSLPAVSVRASVTAVKLGSRPNNPFNQGAAAKKAAAKGGGAPAKQASGSSSTSSSSSSQTTSASGGSSSPSTGGGSSSTRTTTSSTSTTTHVYEAPRLAADQAYTMTVGISQSNGLFTLPGVQRLRPLPSAVYPMLLPLGVLRGGNKVAFAVLSHTAVSGPGRCVPGGVDCEVLVLSPNQIEHLSWVADGHRYSVADVAITAIHAIRYSSVAAAQAARGAKSSTGDTLLHQAGLSAVDLFPFNQGLGTLVDQRNLNAGGN